MLRPIATPLLMGGFEPEVADLVSGGFRESGFSPVITGSASADLQGPAGPLREGDAVGVSLISGDLEMGATGTVTHIDGDRVYAFGHPFYNLGPAAFPLTRAHVYTMLPSLMNSFKISSMGETIGTMQQDRATAIAGTLGKGPTLVPMTITLHSARAGGAPVVRTVKVNLVNDQLFTPLLAYVSMFNTLGAFERQYGTATLAVKSRARLERPRRRSPSRTSSPPTTRCSARRSAVAAPLTMMLGNNIEPVTVEGLDVTVTATETPQTATHRARLARRHPPARRPHGAAQGPHPQLSRRGDDLDRADRDSGERPARAHGAGQRRPAAERHRAARAARVAAAADHRPAA